MKKGFSGMLLLGMVLLLSGQVVLAEQTDYAIGKVGGSELNIGLGARPVGMGEAYVALADDYNATAWNPAGLAQVTGHQLGFMHHVYLQETSLEYLAYAQNISNGAGLGAYVTYLNYGSMDKFDEVNGLPVANGSFTPTVMTGSIGYGMRLIPQVSLGAALKMISQNIDTEQYSAVAVDLGVLYQPGMSGLSFGAALQNLGSKLADADLPQNVKAGAAYQLPFKLETQDTWTLLADVNLPLADMTYTGISIGTEYWYKRFVAARLGYQMKNSGVTGGLEGLRAGLGVKISFFTVDYAMVSFGDLGLTHQMGLALQF